MTDWDHLSDEELAQTWDEVRQLVLESPLADLSLRELAEEIGQAWHYLRADDEVRTLLVLSWAEVENLHGFGRLKTGLLLDYMIAAAAVGRCADGGTAHPLPASTVSTGVSTALAGLGVARATPIELLLLSARARNFLLEEGFRDLGRVLDYLQGTSLSALRARTGVGYKTAKELLGMLSSVSSGRADLVRAYLPLRVCGSGLCFSAAAASILAAQTPEDRGVLSHRLEDGQTLKEVAQYCGRTRARAGQIVARFLDEINSVLRFFPQEKQAFWEAWQRCEPLDGLLGDELDADARRTIAATLSRIVEMSPEGRAISAHRRSVFDMWWKEVQRDPSFYLDGIRVVRFVRERGEPRLLIPFLEYLEKVRGAVICRTSGKATSRRRLSHRETRLLEGAMLDSTL